MSKIHRYIGGLKAGDKITCTDKDGIVISVTILEISIDPTWREDGYTMLKVHHEPSGKDGMLSLHELASWFKQAEWSVVTP